MPKDELPDVNAARDSDPEIAESTSSEMMADRVVEVYSAADGFEAHGLWAILQENGIKSQIVGEQLGNAAGCLPLGEVIAPRIWVREGDARRAREIIEEWTSQPREEWSEFFESDEHNEAEEDPDEEETPHTPHNRFCWLGQLFVIAGVACILFGAVWAWRSWTTMHKYQGTAEGLFVGCEPRPYTYIPAPSDHNIPIPRARPSFSIYYDVQYEFVVDGKTYYSVVQDGDPDQNRLPICFNPHRPEENVVGRLTSPWTILVSMLGIGACLSLVGFRFRTRAARPGHECDTVGDANTP